MVNITIYTLGSLHTQKPFLSTTEEEGSYATVNRMPLFYLLYRNQTQNGSNLEQLLLLGNKNATKKKKKAA